MNLKTILLKAQNKYVFLFVNLVSQQYQIASIVSQSVSDIK